MSKNIVYFSTLFIAFILATSISWFFICENNLCLKAYCINGISMLLIIASIHYLILNKPNENKNTIVKNILLSITLKLFALLIYVVIGVFVFKPVAKSFLLNFLMIYTLFSIIEVGFLLKTKAKN